MDRMVMSLGFNKHLLMSLATARACTHVFGVCFILLSCLEALQPIIPEAVALELNLNEYSATENGSISPDHEVQLKISESADNSLVASDAECRLPTSMLASVTSTHKICTEREYNNSVGRSDNATSQVVTEKLTDNPPDTVSISSFFNGTDMIASDLVGDQDQESSSSGPELQAISSASETESEASPVLEESTNHPGVPALFIFGDSTVDVGNNNHLQTLARANMPPYGRDFDTHTPTGRFCNGRISIDYLASFLGLPLVPSLLSQNNASTMQRGVNFASAGAGILLASGTDLGQQIPFVEQINRMLQIHDELASLLGEQAASQLISQSMYYISIGSNDFIHYYIRNVSGVQEKLSPAEFSNMLVSRATKLIEDLYHNGARKIVSVGIGPLGCAPHYLFEDGSATGGCIDDLNILANTYNSALNVATEDLNRRLRDAQIIFCDVFEALQRLIQSPSDYGFETGSTACCGAGRYGGLLMCIFPQMACSDASTHVWWDEFHLTDKANLLVANSLWSDSDQTICSPMNLQQLAEL
ncbi:hypothetical protein O6H91_15G080500 [Diphasiastrum complanatum]|uniref:Uncharacterized protein n=1 Tax=Diphasiastrum complanatum TaxID=34168 RepID=A0ACC2BK61_DIPCM|nr:hypothetical protein O6H91_Y145800 [Diphasiastrum complanatum]KAJ7530134.1 hypothetical protein O6H91_15G080500 [Diphasiastrum complanatum]